MGTHYYHLSYSERTLIFYWVKKEKISLREVAKRLQRSHSTISRVLRRNLVYSAPYYPSGAQGMYKYKLITRARRFRLKNESTREYVREKLQIG